MKIFRKISSDTKDALSKFEKFSTYQKIVITILVLLTINNIAKILDKILKVFEYAYGYINSKIKSTKEKDYTKDCPDEYDPFDGEDEE